MAALLIRIAQAVRLVASHRLFGLTVTVVGVALCVGLWISTPKPGTAVACLAVGAAVMAVQDLKTLGKTLWVIFVVIMGLIEVRAIYVESAKQQKAHDQELARQERVHIADQRAMNTQFQSILSANGASTKHILDNERQQFSDVIAENRHISTISKSNLLSTREALNQITGGESFAYLAPQDPFGGSVSLAVVNLGKYQLTGVHADIRRFTELPAENIDEDINVVPASSIRMISSKLHPRPGANGIDMYWIFITAQNGTVDEVLEFRRSHDGRFWASRLSVTRDQRINQIGELTPADIRRSALKKMSQWTDDIKPAAPKD